MGRNELLLIAFSCSAAAACSSDPRKSIVGEWQIADDSELARDTVTLSFRKENGTDFPATLSYSLQPSGLLTIEKGWDHSVCCFGGIDRHLVDRHWQTQLPQDRQIEIRRFLARLRPRSLSKDFPFALPEGCTFIYDSRSWAGAGYVQGKIGGLFIFQPGCSGSGAEKAKRLLLSLVEMLPPVDGSAEFVKPPDHL